MKRITSHSTIITLVIICLVVIILSGDNCDECFAAPVMAIKFLICGLVIIVGSIYFKLKFLKTENIIFDIESQPLLETNEAVDGVLFAGEGIVESEDDRILKSPYTNTPCVYFHSIKEIYVTSGKSGHWEISENIALFLPFYLEDKRGRLKIDLTNIDDDFSNYKIPFHNEDIPNPKNSEIDCEAVLERSYTEGKLSFFSLIDRTTKYRKSEFVLRPGTKVFVCGMVSKRDRTLILHEDERCPLIVSQKGRDRYVKDFYQGGSLVYLSHLLSAIGYTIALFAVNYFLRLSSAFLLPLLFVVNFAIAGSVIFSLYNRIITLKQRALNALSNIEIDLKRRADLIPNLVEVAKGYSKHERETQQIIAEARAEIMFTKELPKETKPIIPSLVVTIENYPDLKASENFQSLMRILIDTEERIAYSREFYNRSVRKYNILISQFPFLLISSPLGMKQMDFVSIARGESTPLQVSTD